MVALEGVLRGPDGRQQSWRLAVPLVRLVWECDVRWPMRSRLSDGSIGNAAHQAQAGADLDRDGDVDLHDWALSSQHLPDVDGWVCAVDITAAGVDPDLVLQAAMRHEATWYVIYNTHIYSRTHGWVRQPYHGPSKHTEHLHVSSSLDRIGKTSSAPWGLVPVGGAQAHGSELATMILYAIDRIDAAGKPIDTAPADGHPDELVFREGPLLPNGLCQLVQLAGGPAMERGNMQDYRAAGAGVVHVTREHLRACGYVLPSGVR